MPDNNLLAATAAATELAGQSVNAWSAAQTNKRQRQWQEKMYGVQRQDALADWNMQNEYNSPIQQMARLKAAGLNPALVYGGGQATAMSSQAVRSSSPGSWNPVAPKVDPAGIISGYYNQKMQEAAVRNMDTKNTVLLADAAKKAGELDKLRMDTLKGRSEIKNIDQKTLQSQSMLPVLMEQIKANIERTGAQTGVLQSDKLLKDAQKLNTEMNTAKSEVEKNYIIQKNIREIAMNSASVKEIVQRTLNLEVERDNIRQQISGGKAQERHARAQAKVAEYEAEIQKLEVQYRAAGNRPGDNVFWRSLRELIDKLKSGATPNVRQEGGFNN